MESQKLLKTGITGVCVTAICCFTPALVLLLGAVGLSAWLAWLDYILLPLLVVFFAITIFSVAKLLNNNKRLQG